MSNQKYNVVTLPLKPELKQKIAEKINGFRWPLNTVLKVLLEEWLVGNIDITEKIEQKKNNQREEAISNLKANRYDRVRNFPPKKKYRRRRFFPKIGVDS
jgi:hypothetical protein